MEDLLQALLKAKNKKVDFYNEHDELVDSQVINDVHIESDTIVIDVKDK